MTGSHRRLSFLLVCLVLAGLLPLVSSSAQTVVPICDDVPVCPDGPPIKIQPIDQQTAEPNPNEPDPNGPIPTEPAVPGVPDPTAPSPNVPDPPAPDEPDEPPAPTATSATIISGALSPRRTPAVDIPLIPRDRDAPLEIIPASITIRTRVCDNEGFNPYFSQMLEELEAECPVLTDSLGFSMYTPTLAISKVTTGGVASFSVRANTTVRLESVRPAGYDYESVYTCASALQERQWGWQVPSVKPLAWKTTMAEAVECTWFFVRNSDDVNLTLGKRACPWFDPATLSTATVFCAGTLGTWGDVVLSDTDPKTPHILRPASGETQLSFIDLPPGTYTVTETNVTAGTSWTYMGHCGYYDPADGAAKPTFPLVKSTTFSLTLDQGGITMRCSSTNVQAAPSGVLPGEAAQAIPVPGGDGAWPLAVVREKGAGRRRRVQR